MAGVDNLTPWKEGQSGNPSGKPKGTRNRTTIVREILEAAANQAFLDKAALAGIDPADFGLKNGAQIVDVLTAAQVLKAVSGSTPAFQELMDSTYGKIKEEQKVEHTFTRMGTITAEGAQGKEVKSVSLTFNIGDPVTDPEQEENG